ncbi:MAG TPA: ABC transporter permease [Acidobacteriota bacterium]|nr:ABC transporter permease [Acidobacteriota bacterium]
MQFFLQDVRFGIRVLRKSPAFTFTAILILGLGIGANTIILSVVNALVFRPLPYQDPGRLVLITAGSERLKTWGGALSYPDYLDYKNQSRSVENMTAFFLDGINLTGGEEPERLRCLRVSPEAVPLLGLAMKIGRPFLPDDDDQGRNPNVILSHGLWQRRFGSRMDVLGRSVTINGVPRSVVGVLSQKAKMGFLLGIEPDLWLPLIPPNPPQRSSRYLMVAARLKTGVSVEQAQGEMAVIAGRLAQQYPESNTGWHAMVSGLRGEVDTIAYVLLALLVSAVLGIACTNVANLVLARTSARAKEIAVREALGAGRRRLSQQLLTEGLLLAFLGCCLGVLIAFGACDLIRSASAGSNMEIVDVRPDAVVLAATLLLLLITACVVGLAPALRLSGSSLSRTLKEGGTGSSGGSSRNRLGNTLAAVEIALSLVLLVGGGLAIKSWFRLWHVDPGYTAENVLTARLSLTEASYPEKDRQIAFFQSLLERLKAHSEIRNAGIASALPTMGPHSPFLIQGRSRTSLGEEPQARCTSASPGYFETMAISLKAGRLFSGRDTAGALPVVVVNDTLARKYWPHGNPLGEQVEVWGKPRTIVGVIGDLRGVPLAMRPQPEIYLPFLQNAGNSMLLAVKTAGDPPAIAATLKREIGALDANQPVEQLLTMDRIRASNMGVITLGSRLLGILGVAALMLAAVGLYGVLSYSVAQRSTEFGIRMALGARPGDVLSLVLRQGIRLALCGIVPGLAAAFLLTRVLSRSLYGVSALEPLILWGLALLLAAVSLVAGYVPARRATHVDPIIALRAE